MTPTDPAALAARKFATLKRAAEALRQFNGMIFGALRDGVTDDLAAEVDALAAAAALERPEGRTPRVTDAMVEAGCLAAASRRILHWGVERAAQVSEHQRDEIAKSFADEARVILEAAFDAARLEHTEESAPAAWQLLNANGLSIATTDTKELVEQLLADADGSAGWRIVPLYRTAPRSGDTPTDSAPQQARTVPRTQP